MTRVCTRLGWLSLLNALRIGYKRRLENRHEEQFARSGKSDVKGRSHSGRAAGAADSDPLRVPVAEVLSRAGHELAQLAWLLENLQSHIGPLVQEVAARDTNVLHQMQSLDYIAQKAAALADFVAALAKAAPREWLADPGAAARNVTLADLSSRLGFTGEEKEACPTEWGDCEIF